MKSAKGLPANRESELRDMAALIEAGFTALAMRDNVTLDALNAYQRQRDFLVTAASARYRKSRA